MKKLLSFLSLLFMAHFLSASEPLRFLACEDPRLSQKSEPLSREELQSDEIQLLIQKMLILAGFESDPSTTGKKTRLVGVAAPQVGVMKQIIVIDKQQNLRKKKGENHPDFEVLINPEVVWSSEQTSAIPQGCFSVPEQFVGLVHRPKAVVVKSLNLNGETVHQRYEGYPAHVVQHEIDHLHGIRFPELLQSEVDLHIFPNGEQDLSKYSKEWKKWPHHTSQQIFEKLKAKNYSL